MDYRDEFKTAGDIRAAAYRLSDSLRAEGSEGHDLAVRVHDSICCALPMPSETPAAVSRRAAIVEAIVREMLAYEAPAFDGAWWSNQFGPFASEAEALEQAPGLLPEFRESGDVSGADLVDAFTGWRERLKAVLES